MKTLVSLATLVLALAASGCGGSSEAAAGGGADTATTSREDAELAFAQCLREHGLDVADPSTNGHGVTMRIRPGDRNRTKFREATEECRKEHPGAFPEPTEEQQQEFRDAAVKFAQCMRKHGVDVPDPKPAGSGGGFLMIGPRVSNDPDFRAAQKACERLLPGLREERP